MSDAANAQLEDFAHRIPVLESERVEPSEATRSAVLKAIAEYDRVGQKVFLGKYGYAKSKEYVLEHEGNRYDSKAIYGVARGWRAKDFVGGDLTVRSWLEDLGFKVKRFSGSTYTGALVLTAQEETSGGAYDFWEDEKGTRYHFPNKYRKLVQSGLPFVYYRRVRRKGGKRAVPEYYGTGRIGDVWVDEAHSAERASNRRWFCSIEDYREFPTPVPWKKGGSTLEKIKLNQFRDGVRQLPLEAFERICLLAKVSVATSPKEPDLPPVEEVTLEPVAAGTLFVASSDDGKSRGEKGQKAPGRRSRYSKLYGDHAELLVKRKLEKLGKKGIRHLAAEGITPGYNLEYKEGGRVIAVEVKGTSSRRFTSFELTEGERQAADTHGENYELWLIADLRSISALVEVIRNPLEHFRQDWATTPVLWRVQRVTVTGPKDTP